MNFLTLKRVCVALAVFVVFFPVRLLADSVSKDILVSASFIGISGFNNANISDFVSFVDLNTSSPSPDSLKKYGVLTTDDLKNGGFELLSLPIYFVGSNSESIHFSVKSDSPDDDTNPFVISNSLCSSRSCGKYQKISGSGSLKLTSTLTLKDHNDLLDKKWYMQRINKNLNINMTYQ